MKFISLNFKGYWLEANKRGIPSDSGVYCVYACTYHTSTNKVSLRKILYIGESVDVNNRISNHDRLLAWKRHLQTGETLCYSFAIVNNNDRLRAEAALIYQHKPPCNSEYLYSFPYPETVINTDGENSLLSPNFIV